jgi:Tfp pilus assembly ATPase PilU
MKSSPDEGMQYFDGELQKLLEHGIIDAETALSYATSPTTLRASLGQQDLIRE